MHRPFVPFFALACLLMTVALTRAASGLALTMERRITNPSEFDVIDSERGDRRSMDHCRLPGGGDITAKRDFDTFGDEVTIRHDGASSTVSIPDSGYWGSDRIALDCDPQRPRWFYGHPVKGTITAYSVTGVALWEIRLEPFRSIPSQPISAPSEAVGKHILRALQVRGSYILVEWAEFRIGQYFAVLTTDGKLVEQFGPTTLVLRTSGTAKPWELLWGTSALPTSFIPLALYTLGIVEHPDEEQRPTVVIAGLKGQANPNRRIAAKVQSTPLMDHVVALLWSPTTKDTLDFCPIVSAESAKIWLGSDYDPVTAAQAKRLLLSVWIALEKKYGGTPDGPLNELFQERSKADPELAWLLASMAPTKPAWDAAFRPKALAILQALPATREATASAAR